MGKYQRFALCVTADIPQTPSRMREDSPENSRMFYTDAMQLAANGPSILTKLQVVAVTLLQTTKSDAPTPDQEMITYLIGKCDVSAIYSSLNSEQTSSML
jgi:hypothetical protein